MTIRCAQCLAPIAAAEDAQCIRVLDVDGAVLSFHAVCWVPYWDAQRQRQRPLPGDLPAQA